MANLSRNDLLNLTAAAYEAALDGALWPGVVERLRVAFGASSANVTLFDFGRTQGFVINAGSDPAMVESYVAHYAKVDPCPSVLVRSRTSGRAFTRAEVLSDPAMVSTEYYADWLRPQGIWHGLFAGAACNEALTSGITLTRERHQDDFDHPNTTALEAILPHLGRAIQATCRLAEAKSRQTGVEGLLGRLRDGALLLEANGAVLYANPAAEGLLRGGDGLVTVQGKLRATRASDDAALRRAVASARAGGGGRLGVARPSGRASLAVSVQPVSIAGNSANDLWRIAPSPAALVFVVEPDRDRNDTAIILRALYGLTAAETAVAEAVAQGQGVKEAAEALGIAPSTLRWHLKAVFQKTGTARQAELAGLVVRLGSLAGDGST